MTPPAETVDRRLIEALQLQQLRRLVATLRRSNPFYTAKLRDADLEGDDWTLSDFTSRLPLTTKHEVVKDQADNPPYGSNLTFPLDRYCRFHQTSGTTGRPIRWLDTAESWNWMAGCWTRVYESAGVGPADRVFFAFSFGPFLGFWVAFDAAARLGCLCIPAGGMRTAARLQTILAVEATVLCCTPTYAIHLAEVATEEGINLAASRVRRIIVAGEPGGSVPATRALIEERWPGARVADHHGMTETGPVTYECPERPGVLHVIEPSFFAEVFDPMTRQQAGPGETGELILTNLGRTGSPLLRYRTGDIVRRAETAQCRCGSFELALEGGILGRADDMMVVRGVNVYPSAVEDVIRSCGGIAEYRVEIRASATALAEMSLQIEPLPDCADEAALVKRIRAAMHNAFGLRVEVGAVPEGTLPRFELKARRWFRV